MALSLTALLPDPGANLYYSAGWQLMIETHLPFIRNRTDHSFRQVSDAMAYKYDGDFYGLLTELRIAPKMHWVVMRMNNLRSSFDYRHALTVLVLPNFTLIEQLTERYRTTMTKIK